MLKLTLKDDTDMESMSQGLSEFEYVHVECVLFYLLFLNEAELS